MRRRAPNHPAAAGDRAKPYSMFSFHLGLMPKRKDQRPVRDDQIICIHLTKLRSHRGVSAADHSNRPFSKTAIFRNGILKSSLSKSRT